MSDAPTDVTDVVRTAVRDSGLTTRALSRETGVSPQSIRGLLRGKGIRPATARRLLEFLGTRNVLLSTRVAVRVEYASPGTVNPAADAAGTG